MSGINIINTGLIYRNPKPHLCSVHAYFPSVVTLASDEMLASLVLGEAFESVDLHTHFVRSTDGGESWELQGELYPGTSDRLTSDAVRLTALPDGEIVAFMVRCDRTDHPDEGLASHENMGFVPTELLLLRSSDGGRTWSDPEPLEPPLVGPAFELCCPITPLSDSRWLLPTSTWRGWDGDCPNGMKMVAIISHDRGLTWPESADVMCDPAQRVIYWESKIIELADGALLAAAWGYNEPEARDLPNQYAVSRDGGRTWTEPGSTGLIGQTLTPHLLDDGRVLCVYRRMDESGLWANTSHLDGDEWVNDTCEPLWGARAAGLTATTGNMAHNFNVLRFGAPCVNRSPDGAIFVAFWCYEDCVSNIRWIKLNVS